MEFLQRLKYYRILYFKNFGENKMFITSFRGNALLSNKGFTYFDFVLMDLPFFSPDEKKINISIFKRGLKGQLSYNNL